MLDRFLGADGQRLRADCFAVQKLIAGDAALAAEFASLAEMRALTAGETLIEQDAVDNGIFFIFAGSFDVLVNGRRVARRGPGDAVGEMAAIDPSQRRSATVIAAEAAVVAKLTEPQFADLAGQRPKLYRAIAQELSRRLLQRNRLVGAYRDRIRVFIICSAEALAIARAVQNAMAHDPFLVTVWTDGVFRAAHYTLESLEKAVDESDFAIAIAHADDLTASRGVDWPVPRDNVIFELGLFMGRLGRARAILMEPREAKLRLPSDLAGLTTIPYRFEAGRDAAALLASACNELRDHITKLGPNNG